MSVLIPILMFLAAAIIAFALLSIARRKNVDIIVRSRRTPPACSGLRHIFFCVADHFEPLWNGADPSTAMRRIDTWVERYPQQFAGIRDRGGHAPKHTFFYPAEQYEPGYIDRLARLVQGGWGDIEVHLHHDNDTAEGLRDTLVSFRDALHMRHGLLRRDREGIRYGFIHGNWALDDSGAGGRYCGVKNEPALLRETGCFADFTYPSAPHATQPPIINRIYYPAGEKESGKSHHRGTDAVRGREPAGDLLLITGPLAINWRARRRLLFPAIENGDITGLNPPTRDRVDIWISTAVGVVEWPRWIFVKVHTHGAQERNMDLLLGDETLAMHEYLLSRYNDGERYVLHYVTAWEMFQCVRALEMNDSEAIGRIEAFEYPHD